MKLNIIYNENCIKTLNDRLLDKSIDGIITSPRII
jgi:hypothetical protein